MRLYRFVAVACLAVLGATLTGCAATGLSQDAYAITQAECQATITHLSKTEPEFDGLMQTSVAYAVYPGVFNGVWWVLGAGGSDGLIYDNTGTVIGYSRHARINLGLAYWGEYADFVIFFKTDESLERFQKGGWSINGEIAAGILGLGASGQTSFTEDYVFVSDPRGSFGLGAFFAFDNFSYNDIDKALDQ